MGFFALLNHVINFAAPALWLALLMPLLGRIFMKNRPVALTFIAQAAIHLAAGVVVLLLGLALFGRDGKMLTYLALVLAVASSQWGMQGGRRSK